MEREKTLLFVDDSDSYRDSATLYLHTRDLPLTIRPAASLQQAVTAVETDTTRQIKIALVDGDLGGGQTGEMFIAKIRDNGRTDIVTIGHSTDRNVTGADLQCQKREGPKKLWKTLIKARRLSSS